MGLKFTYINAAFAPAPDDTVGNLYKVSDTPARQQDQVADSFPVLRYGRAFDSQLQVGQALYRVPRLACIFDTKLN